MFSPACAVVHTYPLFAHFLLGRRCKRLSRRLVEQAFDYLTEVFDGLKRNKLLTSCVLKSETKCSRK